MDRSGRGVGSSSVRGEKTGSRQRVLAIVLVALAVPYGIFSLVQWHKSSVEKQVGSDYTTFVKAMVQAEAISDPLQRCLQYPDLPGSHWDVETTRSYCELRTHKTIRLSEIDALLKQGRAADVDRTFQQYLDTQLHEAGHPGLIDIAFENAGFDKSSGDTRRIIDAWKQQSPDSAFALGASGVQYVDAAQEARGRDWARNLGEQQVIDMRRQLVLAKQDLDRSAALLPSLTAVYKSMIYLGALVGDQDYLENASEMGMRADPYNFSIRLEMMNLAQARWGGQFGGLETQRAGDQADAQHNPLLRILAQYPQLYRATCNCGYSAEQTHQLILQAIDGNLTSYKLVDLADMMFDADPKLAVQLYAEALRFDPTHADALQWRSRLLLNMHDTQAAIDVVLAASRHFPENNAIANRVANIYRHAGRIREAEDTYLAVLKRDPDEQFAMSQLGDLYNHEAHQPDKAEALADVLIERHPDDPHGYIVRACNQMDHDLPGRYETIHYFIDHFGLQPEFKDQVAEMRAYLAKHPEPPRA